MRGERGNRGFHSPSLYDISRCRVGGSEHETTPNAGVVFVNPGDDFKRFVVGVDSEFGVGFVNLGDVLNRVVVEID